MLFNDLIPLPPNPALIKQIVKLECCDFIHESYGLPLYKSLQSTYGDIKLVKVRFQKQRDVTSDIFEHVFGESKPGGFKERSVIAYPIHPPPRDGYEVFYVFPTNGYKFIYSPMIKDSMSDLGGVVNTLMTQLDEVETASLAGDLLKYSYQSSNLVEGMLNNSEIIIHNISNFFVVRATHISYQSLII